MMVIKKKNETVSEHFFTLTNLRFQSPFSTFFFVDYTVAFFLICCINCCHQDSTVFERIKKSNSAHLNREYKDSILDAKQNICFIFFLLGTMV